MCVKHSNDHLQLVHTSYTMCKTIVDTLFGNLTPFNYLMAAITIVSILCVLLYSCYYVWYWFGMPIWRTSFRLGVLLFCLLIVSLFGYINMMLPTWIANLISGNLFFNLILFLIHCISGLTLFRMRDRNTRIYAKDVTGAMIEGMRTELEREGVNVDDLKAEVLSELDHDLR